MTPKQRANFIDKFVNWMLSEGYNQDRYNNFVRAGADGLYRFKLSNVAVRLEKQVIHADGSKSWIRLRSGYFSKLSFNDNNQLVGLTR